MAATPPVKRTTAVLKMPKRKVLVRVYERDDLLLPLPRSHEGGRGRLQPDRADPGELAKAARGEDVSFRAAAHVETRTTDSGRARIASSHSRTRSDHRTTWSGHPTTGSGHSTTVSGHSTIGSNHPTTWGSLPTN
jgi:hypothetical protein